MASLWIWVGCMSQNLPQLESLKSRESQVKGLHVDGELEIHTSC